MPSSAADRSQTRRHVVVLILLATGYLSLFMVLRWLQEPLFRTFWAYSGRALPLPETLYLILSACLPLALWAVILYGAWSVFRGHMPAIVVAVVVWLALVFIESDLAWYRLSHQHAALADVVLLVTSDVIGDWAVDPSLLRSFMVRLIKHAIVLMTLWAVAGFVARRYTPRVPKALLAFPPIVLLLVIGDSALVGYALSVDNIEWRRASDQNPVRLRAVDRAFKQLFQIDKDLDRANAALIELRRNPVAPVKSRSASTTVGLRRQPDVLLLVVEGLNPGYIDSTTMPLWTALSARTVRWQQHYSTGNATEYGILGLIFGRPVSFYRGMPLVPTAQPGSPYIDLFIDHGYDARVVSSEISCYADIGAYLQNFNRSAYETRDDWTLIPIITEELGRPGPQLVLSLYSGTHLPYRHRPEYAVFKPEVPDSFDYLTSEGAHRVEEIRNRYRNTLLEFDAWLDTLLENIDLQQTIIVVTGDHGEELFEHGRLGHLSSLEEPQTRTPLLLHAPQIDPTTVRGITSHADIMPTLLDILGWPEVPGAWGQSVFDVSRVQVAVIASKRPIRPPNEWAVVTPGVKSILFGETGEELQLRKLLDRNDQGFSFANEPALWQDNFAQVLRFERLPPPAKSGEFGKRWSTCDK